MVSNLSYNSNLDLDITICVVYLLDCITGAIICDSHATCQEGICVCGPGYQGDGYSCTKGNVVHILIIRLFRSILSMLVSDHSSTKCLSI